MTVRIDETGADDLAGGIEHSFRLSVVKPMACYFDDDFTLNRYIGRIARITSAVGDPPAADQDVEHVTSLSRGKRGARLRSTPHRDQAPQVRARSHPPRRRPCRTGRGSWVCRAAHIRDTARLEWRRSSAWMPP